MVLLSLITITIFVCVILLATPVQFWVNYQFNNITLVYSLSL
jgi:hypothetical protein